MSEGWRHIEITDHGTIVVLRPISDEARDWLSIPRACGHRFHEHVAIDSTNMWPLVPRHVATPLR
jgi:virulence-associated protein VagC